MCEGEAADEAADEYDLMVIGQGALKFGGNVWCAQGCKWLVRMGLWVS